MSSLRFILVGAKPPKDDSRQPGGQGTACLGLIAYARSQDIDLQVIDTSQTSFPVPPFYKRCLKVFCRFTQLIFLLLSSRPNGVIIFSSVAFSFYEKALMCLLCRLMFTRSILMVRSGHFMNRINSSKTREKIACLLLKFPNYIGAQGTPWIDFYRKMGVSQEKIKLTRNWMPSGIKIKEKPIRSKAPFRFLFVGWLIKEKGVLELLEAFRLSKILQQQAHLTLAGDGLLKDDVSLFLQKHKLTHCIKQAGWMTSTEVYSQMEESHCFVLPSYAEGFPNAVVEALAFALPVIATDVGAIGDSVRNNQNGYLIKKNDPQTLVQAMEAFILNPKLVERYSKNSLDIAKDNHSLETNCKKVFELFQS